jgi:CheY-like chemotaxis protein
LHTISGRKLVMSVILLIEDNQDVRENLTEMLNLNGFDVMEAENGMHGLDLMEEKLPDLILSDIMMPIMNGFEFLIILKEDKRTAEIPFVFVTAMIEKKEIEKAFAAGANDYITKPFDLSELINKINSLLSKKI